MALSDLEAYYRAGTFAAGLMKLSETVAEKETNTAATADAQKPGGAAAQAKLAGLAKEAEVKAAVAAEVSDSPAVTKNAKTASGKHKCTAEDFVKNTQE